MIHIIKVFVKKSLYLLIGLFLLIWKRNNRWCLCIGWHSGSRFADNSRYIYLYLNEHKTLLGLKKVVWLTENESIYKELKENGYEVCKKYSLKGIYYHLHAKYLFYDQLADEYFDFLTYESKMINLWHGIPIKKFGLWSGDKWNLRNSYLLTCSVFGDNTIGKAFDLPSNHYIHGMYPRNYYLLREDYPFCLREEMIFLNLLQSKIASGQKIIFYLPTFRKKSLLFLGEKESEKLNDFFSFLQQHHYFLLTKVHFYGALHNHDSILYSNDRILNLPVDFDIYPFLKKTDILLTDYSSVLFDFLYLDKDIICFPYDIDSYKNADRGFLYDYASLPANFVYSLEELKSYLQKEKTDEELLKEKIYRKKWLYQCFGNETMEETVKKMLTL